MSPKVVKQPISPDISIDVPSKPTVFDDDDYGGFLPDPVPEHVNDLHYVQDLSPMLNLK